jgi:hypothetical protein
LPKIFDAVGGDIVQQRRAMRTSRPRCDQRGISSKERLERREIAVNDSISASLKFVALGILTREPLNMICELAPVLEAV